MSPTSSIVPDPVGVILKKRHGEELTDADITSFIMGFLAQQVLPAQMSALLMAICHHGLNRRELSTWTRVMMESGIRLDLSASAAPTVDKHSTGGVGDKTTLILTPLVAACGAAVPQLSGRGLGHTGGTLDKLATIPGWSDQLDPETFLRQVLDPHIRAVIAAPVAQIAPADRELYALRDVTGTVDSIELIASSIMSKKIAEGVCALVLDVKVGAGAFMREVEQARELGRTMVALGEDAGVSTRAVLTAMDRPLGFAVGNALEVAEAVEVLQGGGPADVRELVLVLAEHMLDLAGLDADPQRVLDSGRAFEYWQRLVRAQGGDPDAPLPQAAYAEVVRAPAAGTVGGIHARIVGETVWALGAGRTNPSDSVSAGAGVELRVGVGQDVHQGQEIARVWADDPAELPLAVSRLEQAFSWEQDPATALPLVLEVV